MQSLFSIVMYRAFAPRALAGRRRLIACAVAVLLLAGCGPSSDQQQPRLTVAAANLDAPDHLSARLVHEFSAPILTALHHGVSLSFQWQLELRQRRPGIWDRQLWRTQETRQLSYRSLSQRYTLSNRAAGSAASFPDLNEVIRALNRIDLALTGLPPESGDGQYYRLRARLVIDRLPPALRLPSYLSGQWRMDSGWFEWPRA